MRKLLYLLLTAVLLLAVMHMSAAAEEGTDGFTYVLLKDGTASITACGLRGNIVIPERIDGYLVTNLARQLFYSRAGITSVSIPASVTYFGSNVEDNMWDYVFSYCYDLTSISVDENNPVFCSVDGVLYSKDRSILINYPCAKPDQEYQVPATVENLCCTSFASCKNLRELYLKGKNTGWYTYTFYNTGNLTVYYQPGGRTQLKVLSDQENGMSHEQDSFRCTFRLDPNAGASVGMLIIPDSVREIEPEAFANTAFETVVIPESCTVIGSRAFANCPNLHMISLPSNLLEIASDAFWGCRNMTYSYRKYYSP